MEIKTLCMLCDGSLSENVHVIKYNYKGEGGSIEEGSANICDDCSDSMDEIVRGEEEFFEKGSV